MKGCSAYNTRLINGFFKNLPQIFKSLQIRNYLFIKIEVHLKEAILKIR